MYIDIRQSKILYRNYYYLVGITWNRLHPKRDLSLC